jgi:ADP-ribose pyrophosphatase YjhB (NUDIX family)
MTDPAKDYPLTLEEFHQIYGKVPRLCVEVVLRSDKGVLLSLRDIEPFKGIWHLPGGTVFFGEKLRDAVRRVAKRELGVNVVGEPELLGYIEYPGHYKNRLDSPVGIAFLANYEGEIKSNEEAAELRWFTELPNNLHPDQVDFIERQVLARA